MKLAVALAVVIGSSAFAAPTDDLVLNERTKKSAISSYGTSAGAYGASYGPPCAGAPPLAPIALYLAPQGAPQGTLHYREEEVPEEHNEAARSYEGASYGASAPAISLAPAPVASGGAIGYFPHGKIGPCGVPLLLSCSPNVVAGHLTHGQSYSAPAYKEAEKEEETTELKEAVGKSRAEVETEANLGPHHHHLNGVFLTGDHKVEGEHIHNSSI